LQGRQSKASLQKMSDNATLHFFCGKAGAGKSTLAARLAQETNSILISEDVWLMRLFGDDMKTFEDYIRVSRKLKTVVGPLCIDLLTGGQSVVLDFQANTKNGRAWFRSVFEQAGAMHLLHYVRASDETCLRRITQRNLERPEGSHHLTEEDFFHVSSYFQEPDVSEGLNITVYTT
jgi:predicted kinase